MWLSRLPVIFIAMPALTLGLLASACGRDPVSAPPTPPSTRPEAKGYVRGMSVAHLHARGVGYGSEKCKEQFRHLARDMGVQSVSLTNFAYMPAVDSPVLSFGRDRSMMDHDLARAVADAHDAGLTVLLKPDIWSRQFWGGDGAAAKWHGDIAMTTQADWDTFFNNYTAYVLATAKLAEQAKAEWFCVGVELVGTTRETARWRKLIAQVREVYHGKLTYSCAFTEWKHIEFFDALDAIGIAAYFPLTDKDRATEQDLRAGWEKVYRDLDALAKRTGKPILFTELGYTPAPNAGKEPWSYDVPVVDEAYQARLFQVALDEASRHESIEGVYLWKWFSDAQWRRFEGEDPYAIQTRPAILELLRNIWSPATTRH